MTLAFSFYYAQSSRTAFLFSSKRHTVFQPLVGVGLLTEYPRTHEIANELRRPRCNLFLLACRREAQPFDKICN